jgi:hypothetical protein
MDYSNILINVLAILGGLPIVLKAVAALIPGDKDDKFLGPVISVLEKGQSLLAPKVTPKS